MFAQFLHSVRSLCKRCASILHSFCTVKRATYYRISCLLYPTNLKRESNETFVEILFVCDILDINNEVRQFRYFSYLYLIMCIRKFFVGYIFLAMLVMSSCKGNAENVPSSKAGDAVVAKQTENDTPGLAQAVEASVVSATDGTDAGQVDTLKVYNMSEVDRPPLLSNEELMKQIGRHFKYPDIEPMKGRGLVIVTVERDGTVSAAKTVKSIHPLIDKEFERVSLLLTGFAPATIDGVKVRCTLELPTAANAM